MVTMISLRPFETKRHVQFRIDDPGLGTYVIDVSLPANMPPGERLPVILAVDGNLLFDTVQTIVHGRFATVSASFPASIVVGVGYPEEEGFAGFYARRNFDFHGPWDMNDELGLRMREILGYWKRYEKRGEIEMAAGGYELFMAFLRDRLLRVLADHFPIDLDARHTLIGDSSGGHFALRALFDRTSPFSRYVAISPSLKTAPGTIEKAEAEFAALSSDLPADVFVCAGKQEVGLNRDNALCGFGTAVTWCAEQMALRQWPSLRFACEVMDNENHSSITPRAISAGLRSVYRLRPGVHEGELAEAAATFMARLC